MYPGFVYVTFDSMEYQGTVFSSEKIIPSHWHLFIHFLMPRVAGRFSIRAWDIVANSILSIT